MPLPNDISSELKAELFELLTPEFKDNDCCGELVAESDDDFGSLLLLFDISLFSGFCWTRPNRYLTTQHH